jgi:hypothetical protein
VVVLVSIRLLVVTAMAHRCRISVTIKPVAFFPTMPARLNLAAIAGASASATQRVTLLYSMHGILYFFPANASPEPRGSLSFVTTRVSNSG